MRLFFLRHGEAEEASPDGSDAGRRLTRDGRRQLREVARGMVRLDLRIDRVMSSPLVRARQTAELVAESLHLPEAIQLTDTLEPESDWPRLRDELRRQPARSRLLLVGHMPSLGDFIGSIIGDRQDVRLEIKKASLFSVQVDDLDSGGVLRWALTPKQLALMGR